MKDFKCEFKDCGKEAVGWGLMENTMAALCSEHLKEEK